jgi:flagellar motor switch protein FliG
MSDAAAKAERNGVERAAILLLTLGESEAAEILKHLGAKDVQRLGRSMASLSNVSRDEVRNVLGDFTSAVESQTSLGVGSEDFVRKVLVNALGEEKAASLMDRISLGGQRKGLDALKWMDAKQVAELIRNEHPQIIAIVLSYLESDQAAEVLGCLPEGLRSDLVTRVALLDGIQPSALAELDDMMEKRFANNGANAVSSALGGLRVCRGNGQPAGFFGRHQRHVGDRQERRSAVAEDPGPHVRVRRPARDRRSRHAGTAAPGPRRQTAHRAQGRRRELQGQGLQEHVAARRGNAQGRSGGQGPGAPRGRRGAQKEILVAARKLADEGTIQLGGKGEQYV